MKLYYAPGACSLADRIALHEAGIDANFEKVDLAAKVTESGQDFTAINPKGYVPMLVLDDGAAVSENIAILAYIADLHPDLIPPGALGRTRLIEMLAFISTEIHKGFHPYFRGEGDAEKAAAGNALARLYTIVAGKLVEPYLFGAKFSAADPYLFVTLRWAKRFGVPIPPALNAYFDRVESRDTVRKALIEEGFD